MPFSTFHPQKRTIIIPNLFLITVKILTKIIDVRHKKVLPEGFDLCTLVHVCLGSSTCTCYEWPVMKSRAEPLTLYFLRVTNINFLMTI